MTLSDFSRRRGGGGVLCDCSDIATCRRTVLYFGNSKGNHPGGCSDASRCKPVRSFEDGAPDKLERRPRKLAQGGSFGHSVSGIRRVSELSGNLINRPNNQYTVPSSQLLRWRGFVLMHIYPTACMAGIVEVRVISDDLQLPFHVVADLIYMYHTSPPMAENWRLHAHI